MSARGIKATATFIAAAVVLFLGQTAFWALLFGSWGDPLGFGVLFTLATLPLSGAIAVFAALWASRRIYRAERPSENSN